MTDLLDGIAQADPTYWLPTSMGRPVVMAVTADGAPVTPPAAWFVDPMLPGPTPLVVEPDGRVYGHLATWNQSHIGLAGGVKAPKSASRYAFFATGALQTAEGEMVDVGQITLVGGHAPIEADTARAVAHYDNTNSAVADVAVGEDRYGIWLAGSLRPDVDDRQIRILRASALSGDWRPINGRLELVAACSVNVPGFPIPRARVASGQVLALVAAGVEPIVAERIRQLSAAAVIEALDAVSDRIDMLERAYAAESAPEPTYTDQVTMTVEDVNRLRSRVHAPLVASIEHEAAELRSRVHGDAPTTD